MRFTGARVSRVRDLPPDAAVVAQVEVAAVQNSLSHLSMPQRPEEPRGPVVAPSDADGSLAQPLLPLKPRRQFSSSPTGASLQIEH